MSGPAACLLALPPDPDPPVLLQPQAAPSAAEVLYQNFKEKKTQLNAKTKASVVDRYGNVGQAPPDEELLLGQTERCGHCGHSIHSVPFPPRSPGSGTWPSIG